MLDILWLMILHLEMMAQTNGHSWLCSCPLCFHGHVRIILQILQPQAPTSILHFLPNRDVPPNHSPHCSTKVSGQVSLRSCASGLAPVLPRVALCGGAGPLLLGAQVINFPLKGRCLCLSPYHTQWKWFQNKMWGTFKNKCKGLAFQKTDQGPQQVDRKCPMAILISACQCKSEWAPGCHLSLLSL